MSYACHVQHQTRPALDTVPSIWSRVTQNTRIIAVSWWNARLKAEHPALARLRVRIRSNIATKRLGANALISGQVERARHQKTFLLADKATVHGRHTCMSMRNPSCSGLRLQTSLEIRCLGPLRDAHHLVLFRRIIESMTSTVHFVPISCRRMPWPPPATLYLFQFSSRYTLGPAPMSQCQTRQTSSWRDG
jgi:hypothetical protein